MNKIGSKFLLTALVLSFVLGGVLLQGGGIAEAAQRINNKSLGSIDDIVKEVNKGELSLSKKGLLFFRGGDKIDDVDVFATTFGKDASHSTKLLWHNSNATETLNWGYTPHYLRPAVSRKLYNGKRALMFHNFAPNGQLKYFFKTLSNTRDENSTDTTPGTLTDSVQISDFGEYIPQAFANSEGNFIPQVYGTGVMAVKGYDREIFVAASGPNHPDFLDKTMRLEFFALSADSEGKMTQEPLTVLTQETPFRSTGDSRSGSVASPKIVSLAVGDFDGDKYDNEVALMINTRNDIYIFVYRLTLSNGKLELRSLGDASGIHVFATDQWGDDLESQPVTDMVAGDFDGDGTSEIALLFKIPTRAESLAHEKGWPNGPMTGAIHCKIHKWNAQTRTFDTAETVQNYNKEEAASSTSMYPIAKVSGVVGLRATAADLDGDGRDEIVTILLGYYYQKLWDGKMVFMIVRDDYFCAFPHLAVWKFNKDSIKPIHDDAHVMGGGSMKNGNGDNMYAFNWLQEHAVNKKGLLTSDTQPDLEYTRVWNQDGFGEESNKVTGTNPGYLTHMYALTNFSITAGPFTGTIGNFRTVDDIAVAWRDNYGHDCVTVFKTKLNSVKEFDGFEDGKIVIEDKKSGGTWRGLVAVDMASEGVELGTPTHMLKTSNRSYIAALSAIPYHVDTVNTDGTTLTEQPVNFTYSEPLTDGNMTVTYGKSTTDSRTDTVKQDLSQSVETVFAADPTGTDESVQNTLGTVKGLTAFASAIGGIAHGIQVDNMSPEERQRAVWQPESPTEGLTEMVDFFVDKVDKTNELTNSQTSTTIIDKNITATTHDSILFTDSARHIWRYPVMTRPLPMWLAFGPRIDSTQIDNPRTVSGDKELFLTFTMNENSPIHTSNSVADSMYQPLHEEGNFFSYTSLIPDIEGYNEAGILAEEGTWDFSTTIDDTGITFTEASSDMQHTETKVEPSGFTQTVGFFDRLFNGEKATGLKMPDSENPKTFSKEYNKSEKISYNLKGSSTLISNMAADHTVRMQPFVAKEGAMTFGTAVQLKSDNNSKLWSSKSIYQQKPDPALLLPLKFVKDGINFKANDYDDTAMNIRGIRFYVPDFAFFSDNRLVNGLKYEIRVPLYNASFKDTGNFTVTLSYAENNDMSSIINGNKKTIGTQTVSLGGWRNDKNNNKGTAIFEWTPNIDPKKYYFYVEIDPLHNLSEVHEERHQYNSTEINDYGGNNTGFYPFYVFNFNDPDVSASGVVTASNVKTFRAADDEINLSPLSFKDGDGNTITDMLDFINNRSDDSFVTVKANFNYSGPEFPYAYFVGYVLTPSGKQKIPNAGINTIVDLSKLELDDIYDVFLFNDFALLNGTNELTFTFSPSEVMASADQIAAVKDLLTFGVLTLTEEEIQAAADEYYTGVDPEFELEPIPDNIVSSATSKTYTLNANENVFWIISNVKLNGTSTSDGEDDRDYLDISLNAANDDEAAPDNYGQTAIITVSSIAGYTPKGDYKITVKKSADGNEWTDAEVLTFNAENAENDETNNGTNNGGTLSSSSSGCNTGLGMLAFFMSGFIIFRKKN